MKKYDLIIVGAGPAGIFTALEIMQQKSDFKILIIEKGNDIDQRKCVSAENNINCQHCNPCSIVCGWGGAGAFSDGKLTLSPEVGGMLGSYISQQVLVEMIKYIDSIYLKYGAPEKVYGLNET